MIAPIRLKRMGILWKRRCSESARETNHKLRALLRVTFKQIHVSKAVPAKASRLRRRLPKVTYRKVGYDVR